MYMYMYILRLYWYKHGLCMLIYISMSYYLLSNSLSSLNCTWFAGFTVSNAVLCGFYALNTI